MIQYAEKRDFLRMPIDCDLFYSESGSDQRQRGHVINLSSKGILFTSRQDFPAGTRLELLLTSSNTQTPDMNARVLVTRVINNNAVFEIACEIEEIR